MVRKLRIRGQTEYANGTALVYALAERFGIPSDDADDLVSFVWTYKEHSQELIAARSGNYSLVYELLPKIITDEDFEAFIVWRMLGNIEWPELSNEEQRALSDLYRAHRFSVSVAANVGEIVRLNYFLADAREKAISASIKKQAGHAANRPPIEVNTYSHPIANFCIEAIIAYQSKWTKGVDNADYPNPAIRLPGEIELFLRRMATGDIHLLAGMMDANKAIGLDEIEEEFWYWRDLLYAMLGIDAKMVTEWHRKFRLDTWRMLTCLIIDYCQVVLKRGDSVAVVLTTTSMYSGLNLPRVWQSDGSTRRSPCVIDVGVPKLDLVKLCVAVLHYSFNECDRETLIPQMSFRDHVDDRGLTAIEQYQTAWWHAPGDIRNTKDTHTPSR